jgi:hypothetical protein
MSTDKNSNVVDRTGWPKGTEEWDAPKPFCVERDGDLDLVGTGWVLGKGESGSGGPRGYSCDWNRGVKVRVLLTRKGKLVTSRHRWSNWQGESARNAGAVHDSPEEALAWLRDEQECSGQLLPAEKEAWEAACEKWIGLDGLDCEGADGEPAEGTGDAWDSAEQCIAGLARQFEATWALTRALRKEGQADEADRIDKAADDALDKADYCLRLFALVERFEAERGEQLAAEAGATCSAATTPSAADPAQMRRDQADYRLTRDHAASSYGEPVLVGPDGTAYGEADTLPDGRPAADVMTEIGLEAIRPPAKPACCSRCTLAPGDDCPHGGKPPRYDSERGEPACPLADSEPKDTH